MPKFNVLSRVDAFVDYITEVEAENADEAAQLAFGGDPSVIWKLQGVSELDDRRVVTLDTNGEEIEATAQGDL